MSKAPHEMTKEELLEWRNHLYGLDTIRKKDIEETSSPEWAKKHLLDKFNPYFNQSLGITIESADHIRQLEKQGNIFMSPDEYQKEGKKIKETKKVEKRIALKKKIEPMVAKLKQGYSYTAENKAKGYE